MWLFVPHLCMTISHNKTKMAKTFPATNAKRAVENSMIETEKTLLSGVRTHAGLGSSHTDLRRCIRPDS